MAFRRTVFKLVDRVDIHPALKKLWKKYSPVEGQVTQHLSPFEQNHLSSLFYDAPNKIFKRFLDFVAEAGFGLGVGIGIYYYAEWKHKEIAYHHRT